MYSTQLSDKDCFEPLVIDNLNNLSQRKKSKKNNVKKSLVMTSLSFAIAIFCVFVASSNPQDALKLQSKFLLLATATAGFLTSCVSGYKLFENSQELEKINQLIAISKKNYQIAQNIEELQNYPNNIDQNNVIFDKTQHQKWQPKLSVIEEEQYQEIYSSELTKPQAQQLKEARTNTSQII